MKIEKVTITGADDKVNHDDIINLSKEYPFVEWGILFSPSREGTNRYPSTNWINELLLKSREEGCNMDNFNCSAHLCGDYALQAINEGNINNFENKIGQSNWLFQRYQLNFNNKKTPVDHPNFINFLKRSSDTFILQYNKSNQEICEKVISKHEHLYGRINFLYDGSGGRGVTPKDWNGVIPNHMTGYAGGLNPDNLEKELININKAVVDNTIWIDTETGVRTDFDNFDLNKVVKFLNIAKEWIM